MQADDEANTSSSRKVAAMMGRVGKIASEMAGREEIIRSRQAALDIGVRAFRRKEKAKSAVKLYRLPIAERSKTTNFETEIESSLYKYRRKNIISLELLEPMSTRLLHYVTVH
ncbi:hypothetical protein J6590_068298 [Homalodisca vitripennis]|nr:hypothetical protein J6590_068298 [Homalodisca vitripennis]